MQEAISKADVLIEALGWIRRFRGKITVIKLGGSVMEDPDALRHTLIDVIFMESVGMRPVVVHGAGAEISRAMDQAGLAPRFVRGRRVTDAATLEIVERVLGNEVNANLANEITRLGGEPARLAPRTECVLFGQTLAITDEDGQPLDLGFVGEVTRVDRNRIVAATLEGRIPLIPSVCLQEGGRSYLNVNADTAATAVAEALGAEKLVFLSDVNGVRRDKKDPDSLIHTLDAQMARDLIADGRIETGMIPKVEGCLKTLGRGVSKVHIVDGKLRHSLLLEIYTNRGVGTQFVKQLQTPE